MTLVGQPPPSPALQQGFELLAQGKPADAEAVVKKAAMKIKAQHGSGSHPLARAYAELARLHLRMGYAEKAAREFQHAASGPLPAEKPECRDRLSFLFGLGAALTVAGMLDEAEQVLRRCIEFARKLDGARSALAAVALVPLADVLLRAEKVDEALQLATEAYDTLWHLGDPLFAVSVGTRAEALQAAGKTDNPFNDLKNVPDEIVVAAVANTLDRAGKGHPGRVRAVLADLLAFVDQKFGDGHTVTYDTLAAIAHHETAFGEQGDPIVRKNAVRRFVWSYAVRRVSGGLLTNLEVVFEPGGELHLAPHLARETDEAEAEELRTVLAQAVADLYARPARVC